MNIISKLLQTIVLNGLILSFVYCETKTQKVNAVNTPSGSIYPSSYNSKNEINNKDENNNKDEKNENDEYINDTKYNQKIKDFIHFLYSKENKSLFGDCGCDPDVPIVFEDCDEEIMRMLIGDCTKAYRFGKPLQQYYEGEISDVTYEPPYPNWKSCPIVCGTYNINNKNWDTARVPIGPNCEGPLYKWHKYKYHFCNPISLCQPVTDSCGRCPKKSFKRALRFDIFKTRSYSKCMKSKADPCAPNKCDQPKMEEQKFDYVSKYVYIQPLSNRNSLINTMKKTNRTIGSYMGYNQNYRRSNFKKDKYPEMDEKNINRLLEAESEDMRDQDNKSYQYYNNHLRRGNEIFLPHNVVKILIKKFKERASS